MDIKSEALASATATLQKRDDLVPAESAMLALRLADQAWLADQSTGTAQQHLKWSAAAKDWLSLLQELLTAAKTSKSQMASCLAAASLFSCSSSMFAEHFSAFAVHVLDALRKQSAAEAARSHLWQLLTAIFSRIQQLLSLPGLRRDASSLAPKLVATLQSIQAAIDNQKLACSQISSEVLKALNSALQALPTAFRSHQKALTAFAVKMLAASDVSFSLRSEAAHLYALLPRLTGDAETWSSYMQNSLCACHARLDIAYLGMDDAALKESSRAALQPQAQPFTAPEPTANHNPVVSQPGRLAGQSMQSVHSVAALQTALDQLGGFFSSIERLLTGSFPVAVPIPAHGILMLLTRILSLDDSARQAGQVPPSASAYLVLLAAFSALHTYALQLLQTLLGAGQGALLPHHASIARLLAHLLRQAAASQAVDSAPGAQHLRQQVYETASVLLDRGGRGVGSLLGSDVVRCALLELYGSKHSRKRPAEEGLPNGHPPKKQKKGKKDDALPSLDGMLADGEGLGGQQQSPDLELSSSAANAQQAALHLLQSLLQASGSSMPQRQRCEVDAIAAHMASTALLAVQSISHSYESGSSSSQAGAVALHLAALKTLLASVLCPAPHRPTFLPQALDLFTQGLYSAAPQIASFSQQALLALEGIIHPRAGLTILQPHTTLTNTGFNKPTSTGSDCLTELGMPKLWSAVTPGTHLAPQPQAENSQSEKAGVADKADAGGGGGGVGGGGGDGGTDAAREVLRASQVYATAVAKLEAALTRGAADQAVAHTADAPALRQQDKHNFQEDKLHSSVQGAIATTSTAPIGVVSHQPVQITTQSPTVKQSSMASPAVPTMRPDVTQHEQTVSVQQPQAGSAEAAAIGIDQGMASVEDDGYISLYQKAVSMNRGDAVGKQTASRQGVAAAASLLSAAESSDSQGSLPEIDSGQSSDSSDNE